MNGYGLEKFVIECNRYLNHVEDDNVTAIECASRLCIEAIRNGGKINVFGLGHSSGVAIELENELNEYDCVQKISSIDLVLKNVLSITEYNDRNNKFAQNGELANKLYNLYNFSESDIFILVSNSGISKLMIEFAQIVKNAKFKIIVVTSLKHTSAVQSRHESGTKLLDYADVIIDNHGPLGDTLISMPDGNRVCSISSITSAVIAHQICKLIKQN